jgi:hypothetical protein
MFGMLAVLDYLAALAIPVFLIRHFGAAHWFWHLVSIGAALTLGLTPLPIREQAWIWRLGSFSFS